MSQIKACGDDHNLALWFTPDAIRDHFEDDPLAKTVAALSDADLIEIGQGCLSGDGIYNAFHEALVMELERLSVIRYQPQDGYWCDSCQDHFHGSAAIIHKGARCHVKDDRPTERTS